MELRPLKVCLSGLFNYLFLGLAKPFQLSLQRTKLKQLSSLGRSFALALKQLVLLEGELFTQDFLLVSQNIKVLLG